MDELIHQVAELMESVIAAEVIESVANFGCTKSGVIDPATWHTEGINEVITQHFRSHGYIDGVYDTMVAFAGEGLANAFFGLVQDVAEDILTEAVQQIEDLPTDNTPVFVATLRELAFATIDKILAQETFLEGK